MPPKSDTEKVAASSANTGGQIVGLTRLQKKLQGQVVIWRGAPSANWIGISELGY